MSITLFTDEEILDIARDNPKLTVRDLSAVSGLHERMVASLLLRDGGFTDLLEDWRIKSRKEKDERIAKYRADNPELIRKLEAKAIWSEFARDLLGIINAGGSLTTNQIQCVMGKQS